MKLIHEEKIRLRTSDYDKYDRVKIHSLLDLFQDIAGRHAAIMKIGYYELQEKNLIWVLLSSKVEILGMIPYDSEVIVRTWPNEKGRVDFIRDYEIETETGDIVVKASSRWVIMNHVTRNIARPRDIEYNGELLGKKNFDEMKKINVVIPHTKEFIKSHKVVNNDLDHNGHMNNSRYMEMIYNMIDIDKSKGNRLVQIDYIHEALLCDSIDVYTFKDVDATYYVGYINLVESFIVKIVEE